MELDTMLMLAFLFLQQYLAALYKPLLKVIPWVLTIPLNNTNAAPVATALMTGAQPATYLPVFTTLGAAALFVAIAAWVFQRAEL